MKLLYKIKNEYSYFNKNNEDPYSTTKPKYINNIKFMDDKEVMNFLISTKENGTTSVCRTSNKK